jgi:hypothetical protein
VSELDVFPSRCTTLAVRELMIERREFLPDIAALPALQRHGLIAQPAQALLTPVHLATQLLSLLE